MEEMRNEAVSIACILGLDNLIAVYDNNMIIIDESLWIYSGEMLKPVNKL